MTFEENDVVQTEDIPEETEEPAFDDSGDNDWMVDLEDNVISNGSTSAQSFSKETEQKAEIPKVDQVPEESEKKDVYSDADHPAQNMKQPIEVKEKYSAEAAALAARALSEYVSKIKDNDPDLKFAVLYIHSDAAHYMFECNFHKKKLFELSGCARRHEENEKLIFGGCQKLVDNKIWKSSMITDECRNAPTWVTEVLETAYRISKEPTVSSVIRLDQFEIAKYMDMPVPCSPEGDPDLFELTDTVLKEQGAQKDHLFTFIHKHIIDMSVHQLTNLYAQYGKYLAEHKHDDFYSRLKWQYGCGDALGDIFEKLRNNIFKYIFEEAQAALSARVNDCQDRYETLARELFLYRIPVPNWLKDCMDIYNDNFRELNAQILWAWVYAVQNVPDEYKDMFTEESKEYKVSSHLCDILPELKKFYSKKYVQFWGRYDNPKRPRIFEDQTESYRKFRKYIHLPEDFNTYSDYEETGGDS